MASVVKPKRRKCCREGIPPEPKQVSFEQILKEMALDWAAAVEKDFTIPSPVFAALKK